MKTHARARLAPDALRTALINLGLTEEEKPIAGYSFTHWKEPHAAVAFWREQHDDEEPTRFYVTQRTYILSA